MDAWEHIENARTLLKEGDFINGWAEYEHRWDLPDFFGTRDLPVPLWDGSDLDGRTLLLRSEQGYGDTIQFCRYAKLIEEDVILQVQPRLHRLLSSFDGVTVVPYGEPLPHFDVHLSMMSLPYVFGTTLGTIPCEVPYLFAEPWTAPLSSQKNIGIMWEGTPEQKVDPIPRACSLEALMSLHDKGNLISLRPDDWKEIIDFSDTASLIMSLDVIVTIDTAMAHLAGALGVPTYLMLPTDACWRWLDRDTSPWYPTMKIFRQTEPNNWNTVIQEIYREL